MNRLTPLTARQREILALTARGLQRKEIARELGITWQTVRSHRSDIRKVIGEELYRQAVYRGTT